MGEGMTFQTMKEYVGRTGTLETYQEGLLVGVTILDARVNRGDLEVLVEPVVGEGQRWVKANRVTPDTADLLGEDFPT